MMLPAALAAARPPCARLVLLRHARPALQHCARRTHATEATDAAAANATTRAQATQRRFWKSVGLSSRAGGQQLAVALDGRALKTPGGAPLVLPARKALAATLVAAEWDNQETVLKQHSLPMTSLVSRAIDALQAENAETRETRDEVCASVLKYLDTDSICFHATGPAALVKRQRKHWAPLLQWVNEQYYGIEVHTTTDIALEQHDDLTYAVLGGEVAAMDEWELAAMERAVHATKSFIIALALVKRRITAEQAAEAAHVEVNSQIELWGMVEDSHDVDFHDIRRQLGSAACLVANHEI